MILSVKPRIDPTMMTFKPVVGNDLGLVILANSITLTPGTVTTRLEQGVLEVHALTGQGMQDLVQGPMVKKVASLQKNGYSSGDGKC